MFNFKKSKQESLKTGRDTNQNDNTKIPNALTAIKDKLNQEFANCSDFVMREILLGSINRGMIIASIDGFVDKKILSENIIEPILQYYGKKTAPSVLNLLKESVISSGDLKDLNTFSESVDAILSGDAVLYIDGEETAIKVGLTAPEKRPVGEPNTEISIKGSREGFTENLRTNTILLRRRIRNTNFKIETLTLGEETNTSIAICYIQGIARQEIIDEVKKRLNNIKTDSILASGMVEQYIQDSRLSLFPMVGNSEKPDKVAAKLLEGRVAIISDGTPIILTVPYLMIESLQAVEDYTGEYFFASLMRILRFSAVILSVYLPALYVALTSFHQSVIPFKLMLTMAASREGIPFSSLIETLIMILVFEILRETGLRMPRAIGQAVSIVGAIVLGDAAVSAGIASAPVVIVTGLSGICSFIVPPLMKAGTIFRIFMLIAANILGFLGIGILSFIVLTYLCRTKSFGVPYLSPFTGLQTHDLKDSLIVVPIWTMFGRPRSLAQAQSTKRTNSKGGRKHS